MYQLPYLPERIAVHKMCEWGILAFANPPRAVPRRDRITKSALQLADKSAKEAGVVLLPEGGREAHGTSAAAAPAKDHYTTADSTITTGAKSAVKAAKSGGRSTSPAPPAKKRASTSGRPSGGAKPTTSSAVASGASRAAASSVLKKTTNKPGAKKIILRSRKAGTKKPAAAHASGIKTEISQVPTTTSTAIIKTAGEEERQGAQQDDKAVNYVLRGEKSQNKVPRQEPKKKSSNARGQSRKIRQEKKEKVNKQRLTEQLSLLRTELQASRNRTVGGTAQLVPVTTGATGAARSSASKQKRNTAQQAKSSRTNVVKTQQATTTSVDVTGNRNAISTRKMKITGVEGEDVLADERKKRKTVLMNKRGAIVGEANNEGKVVRYDEGKEPAENKASSSTRPAPKDIKMDSANTPGGGEGRVTSSSITATKKAKGTPNALNSTTSQVDAAPPEKMSAAAPSAAAGIGSSAGSSATGGIENVSSELQKQPRFNISDTTKAALLSAMHEKRRRREQEKLDVVAVSATAPGKMKSRTTQIKLTTSAEVVPSAHQLPGGTTAPDASANRRPGSAPTAPATVQHAAKTAEQLASSATTLAKGTSIARIIDSAAAPADTSSTRRPSSTVAIYLPKNFVPLKVPHRYFSEAYETSLISTCTGNSKITSGAAPSSSSTTAAQDRDRHKDPGAGARRPASLKRGREQGQSRASEGGANKAILPSKQRLPREGIDYPKPPEREPLMPERKAPYNYSTHPCFYYILPASYRFFVCDLLQLRYCWVISRKDAHRTRFTLLALTLLERRPRHLFLLSLLL